MNGLIKMVHFVLDGDDTSYNSTADRYLSSCDNNVDVFMVNQQFVAKATDGALSKDVMEKPKY